MIIILIPMLIVFIISLSRIIIRFNRYNEKENCEPRESTRNNTEHILSPKFPFILKVCLFFISSFYSKYPESWLYSKKIL